MEQIFTLYRGEIVDKAYHQLRTTDHVSRFRPGVLEALAQLSSEQQVLQIAQSLRASGMAPTVEAAASRALTQTREIHEQFEQLDRLLPGGFASPTVVRLLRAVRPVRPNLPLLHWGDPDAGGLRILAHLREHIGNIAPLAMSPAIFDAYRAFSQPLTPADRAALAALHEHSALADCVPLIDRLLAADR